ncbi:hypothetical protein MMC25_003874 [Agyrium rufum]|nr:hypothetical protein [Agyrium rufum]
MSMPRIPARPARSQHTQPPAPTMGDLEPPKVPPRPTKHRASDRSRSPHKESFAPSPLNDSPFAAPGASINGNLYHDGNASSSSLGLPQRPPSVSLPSIGQEGSEYADIGYANNGGEALPDLSSSPTHSRNVGTDLPLYAPKPTTTSSNQKASIQAVTRTDSSQAAAIGIGKPIRTLVEHDDKDPRERSLRERVSFNRPDSSASTERPESLQENLQGIPEIGQRVPMYPNAGDVQAPSPSPFGQVQPSGIGFHNDGSQSSLRNHRRSLSGKGAPPPGSYGLHGHGNPHNDKFEKAWYDKHPEAVAREGHGKYGPGLNGNRGEWALSSEDLNKIVRETASRGSGFGTSPDVVGLPNEQIGYMASEEYASRKGTPKLGGALHHVKSSSTPGKHTESPLRKASFPLGSEQREQINATHASGQLNSDQAIEESEADDDVDVIHIDAPQERKSKIGGNGYDPPTQDLGPRGGNTEALGGWIDERGYGVPILASDEVAKETGHEYLQPAISPAQSRRGSAFHAGVDSDVPLSYQSGFRNPSRSGSASNSRPGSIHGQAPGLARFVSIDDRDDIHTPLEDVEEFEPLFPEEDEKMGKPDDAAARFKQRPDVIKRRFPSQDIWEDTPNSLQLQAEVTSPEPNQEQQMKPPSTVASTFESPEKEAARKEEVSEEERAKLIPKEERLAKSHFKPHLREDMQRPGMRQRFPSQDIWEDTPNSAQLETTVDGPQDEEVKSPDDAGLRAGAVVITAGRPDHGDPTTTQSRDGATAGSPAVNKPMIPPRPTRTKHSEETPDASSTIPSLPARPVKRVHQVAPAEIPSPPSKVGAESKVARSPNESRAVPSLPERTKPQVPARPTRPPRKEGSIGEPLSKTTSAASLDSKQSDASAGYRDTVTSLPAAKPKPTLPARPAGGKIASLKAGFLSNLEQRLQLGPQAPTKPQEKSAEEELEEKAPLQDARKSRARGPARRKPAVSPAPPEPTETKTSAPKLSIAEPWSIWQISTDGNGVPDLLHKKEAKELPSTSVPAAAKEEALDIKPEQPFSAGPGIAGSNDGPVDDTPITSSAALDPENAHLESKLPAPNQEMEMPALSGETVSHHASEMSKDRCGDLEATASAPEPMPASTLPAAHDKEMAPSSEPDESSLQIGGASTIIDPSSESAAKETTETGIEDEEREKLIPTSKDTLATGKTLSELPELDEGADARTTAQMEGDDSTAQV